MSDTVQKYPAWRFHPIHAARTVDSEAEDVALGPGWLDSHLKLPAAAPVAEASPTPPEPVVVPVPVPDPFPELPERPAPDPTPDDPEPVPVTVHKPAHSRARRR